MNTKKTKYIHEGPYVAAVEVDSIITGDGWSPALSLQDAYRLDEVREALRDGNWMIAPKNAQLFIMQPITGGQNPMGRNPTAAFAS
uniref:Uncharacterized protein n=1 Tax=Candidatus Kentrum sp. DK TaxID=2126562 RepID=A0A450S2I8_9GAMM|nr:MAG: hypothetical protein BECKDK2373B_GA0170837_101150 [Candidatus Kentron sp. DK]